MLLPFWREVNYLTHSKRVIPALLWNLDWNDNCYNYLTERVLAGIVVPSPKEQTFFLPNPKRAGRVAQHSEFGWLEAGVEASLCQLDELLFANFVDQGHRDVHLSMLALPATVHPEEAAYPLQ
jgi:hypothetical protein